MFLTTENSLSQITYLTSIGFQILYGDAAEHRNMPVDDAIRFIYKDFINKTKKLSQSVYQHPDAIQSLLKTLADNRSLTVLQYDHIIKYLNQRKEVQRRAELGEDAGEIDYSHDATVTSLRAPSVSIGQLAQANSSVNPENELQKKILEILNKKPLVQQLAKKVEQKSQPMSQAEKEELKKKLLQDDKIKMAMMALRNSKKH